MRSTTSWARLLGLVKGVVEDVFFDEDGECVVVSVRPRKATARPRRGAKRRCGKRCPGHDRGEAGDGGGRRRVGVDIPTESCYGCDVTLRARIAVALGGCLLIIGLATPAEGHGQTAQMPINQVYSFLFQGNCSYSLSHGNYIATAFSKIRFNNYPCSGGWTYVTGCTGFNCPNGNFITVPASSIGVWWQSSLPWKSVLWSHYGVFHDNGASVSLHKNVF